MRKLDELYEAVAKLEEEYGKNFLAYHEKKGNYNYYLTKNGKAELLAIKNARKEFYNEYDAVYPYYHEDNWITSYCTWDDTMEEARKEFVKMVSKYDGVEIIDNKSGIKSIAVYTRFKKYEYSVHASVDGRAFVYAYDFVSIRDKFREYEKKMNIKKGGEN